MMFVYIARRAQMSEVLSGGRGVVSRRLLSIEHPRELPGLEPSSVAAIWSRDPGIQPDLPEVLLTNDGQERDWLAWLINFAPVLRPFTAFCRVMSCSSFADQFDSFQAPNLGTLGNACLGLILGEALSSEDVLARNKETLTVSAYVSTLSFALVRELAIQKRPVLEEAEISRRWWLVRQLTRQRERDLEHTAVVGVARIVGALLRNSSPAVADSPVLRACQEISASGELANSASAFGSNFENAVHNMGGTRVERVDVFERALATSMSAPASLEEAFALGYLASRINPGTLAHAQLLAPALHRHSSVMLWYGVCAGLNRDSRLMSELGGIGRRIMRELLAPDELVARPRIDIAANELEVLLAGERTDEFPVGIPSQLSVELAPGVSTIVNWSSRARSKRISDEASRPDERAWLLQDLGAAISRLMDLHSRIRGSEPQEREPEQISLYEPRPERRGTRKR